MANKLIISRLLLALAATVFIFGAVFHAETFLVQASRLIEASTSNVFFSKELKVLWLADSTTLAGLGLLLGMMAAKPALASSPVLIALCWIPAGTTGLLYLFLGPFFAAHLLMAATVMVIVSAHILPPHRPAMHQDQSGAVKAVSST